MFAVKWLVFLILVAFSGTVSVLPEDVPSTLSVEPVPVVSVLSADWLLSEPLLLLLEPVPGLGDGVGDGFG